MSDDPIVVVGAGLAGLACAVALHDADREVVVLEAGDGVGGRVRTDHVDGYLLDRGFQVMLTAYPEAHRQLDLDALRLRAFDPGALIHNGRSSSVIVDPFRSPTQSVRCSAESGRHADRQAPDRTPAPPRAVGTSGHAPPRRRHVDDGSAALGRLLRSHDRTFPSAVVRGDPARPRVDHVSPHVRRDLPHAR